MKTESNTIPLVVVLSSLAIAVVIRHCLTLGSRMALGIISLLLLHSASSLYIHIDGDNGKDLFGCLREQFSCRSLEYVADSATNITDDITMEVVSPSLRVHGNVTFAHFNNLTITGQGAALTNIIIQSHTAGISFFYCEQLRLSSFTLTVPGHDSPRPLPVYHGNSSVQDNGDRFGLFVFNPRETLMIDECIFTSQSDMVNDNNVKFYGVRIKLWHTQLVQCFIRDTLFSNFSHNGTGLKFLLQNSSNITLDITNVSFVNSDPGLNVFIRNSSYNDISVMISKFQDNKGHGLGLYYDMSCSNRFYIFGCYFANNNGTNGAALDILFSINSSSNYFNAFGNYFTGNVAQYAGGGVNIVLLQTDKYTYPAGNSIAFRYCHFIKNNASFAGGVGIIMASVDLDFKRKTSFIKFAHCHFESNQAFSGSAIHITRNIPRETGSYFIALVFFYNCDFSGNRQRPSEFPSRSSGKVQSGAFYANKVWVYFGNRNKFTNNSNTALQASSTTLTFKKNSTTIFERNQGIKGGAVLLTGDSEMLLLSRTTLIFNNNTAVSYGGAVAVLKLQVQSFGYSNRCFMSTDFYSIHKPKLSFMGNKCDSNFGNDLFISNLDSCIVRCQEMSKLHKVSQYDVFTEKCFGAFNFSAQSIATATKYLDVSSTVKAVPGMPLKLDINQTDFFHNDSSALFPLTLKGHGNITIKPQVITNHTLVTFYGNPGKTTDLFIQTETMTSITVTTKVILEACPPGFVFDNALNICICSTLTSTRYLGIRYCTNNFSAITVAFWAGYLDPSNESDDTFLTGHCSINLCNYKNSDHKLGFYQLPVKYKKGNLDDVVCSHNRTGSLCTQCITGHTVFYHSPSFKCGESHYCRYGIFLYVVSELLPITVIFIIVITFKIYLTSGILYTFIFYAQIIDNLPPTAFNAISFSTGMSRVLGVLQTIYGLADFNILNTDLLSFCIMKDLSILDLFMVKYITTLYALCLVLVTIVFLKLNSLYTCVKLCRKCGRSNIRGSVINGLTAFIVLCYCQSVSITFKVLIPSKLVGKGYHVKKSVLFFGGDIEYMSRDHLKYVIPAIVCLIVIILPPPIILLSEPLLVRVSGVLNIRRNAITYTLHRLRMKLKPFLDSFQGCFRDNCRCFAGLFFLYRILILLPMTFSGSIDLYYINASIILFMVLLLHSLVRPFESKQHNYLDIFLLTNIILFNMLTIINYFISVWKTDQMIIGIPMIQSLLMSFPIIIVVVVPLGHYASRRIKVLMCKRQQESEDLDISFPARLLEENDHMTESYGTF